jgi:hypothetical protein
VRFNYGDKPSQYVLLQYGFVPMNNPSECVEVALHLKKTDPLRREKLALLAKHDLSPRERNFHFFPRRVDAVGLYKLNPVDPYAKPPRFNP